MLLAAGVAAAQSSVMYTYPDEPGKKVLVCTDPASSIDIVCHMNASGGNPKFSYVRPGSGASHAFWPRLTTPAQSNSAEYLDTTFYVEDMVVLGDYCFFCGRVHIFTNVATEVPIVPGETRENSIDIECGFVAKFSISGIMYSNQPSGMSFVPIPETENVIRIKTHPGLGCIGALAEVPNIGRSLLFMDHTTASGYPTPPYATSYPYQLVYPATGEMFTDFAFTDSLLVVVSSWSTPYTLGIRKSLVGDVLTLPIPSTLLSTSYRYDASMINTTVNPRHTPPTEIHKYLRVTDMPQSDEFIVAYESSGGGVEDSCRRDSTHTCLFRFDGQHTPPSMDQARLLSLDEEYMGGLEDVRYTPLDDMVILMYRRELSTGADESIVQYPSLNTTGQVPCQYMGRYKFMSMDVTGAASTSFAGWDAANDCVTYLWHDLSHFPKSCRLTLPTAFMEKMDIIEPEIIETDLPSETGWGFWNGFYLSGNSLSCERDCSIY